jgi:hypothetical protein
VLADAAISLHCQRETKQVRGRRAFRNAARPPCEFVLRHDVAAAWPEIFVLQNSSGGSGWRAGAATSSARSPARLSFPECGGGESGALMAAAGGVLDARHNSHIAARAHRFFEI